MILCAISLPMTAIHAQDDTSRDVAAQVEGKSPAWATLPPGNLLTPLPQPLQETKISYVPTPPLEAGVLGNIGPLVFRTTKPGWVVIGAAFHQPLDFDFPQFLSNGCRTRQDLLAAGLEPFGQYTLAGGFGPGDYTLFRKQAQEGEAFTLLTHPFRSVMLFQVDGQMKQILDIPTWKRTLLQLPARAADKELAQKCEGVALLTHDASMSDDQGETGVMIRELFRQALLIAAREELGLPTSDQSLRETIVFDKAGYSEPLTLLCTLRKSGQLQILVARCIPGSEGSKSSPAYEVLWEHEQKLQSPFNMPGLVSAAEEMSRKQFRELLVRIGFPERKPVNTASAKAPAKIEQLSNAVNLVQLYASLRELHSMSSSTEQVDAMARGYATLSSITQPLWSPANKALAARSLLYAQRAIHLGSETPKSLKTRAYCRALTGWHGFALDDLKMAEAATSEPPTDAIKSHTAMIKAFCEFNSGKFNQITPHTSQADLHSYLKMLLSEHISAPTVRFRVSLARLQEYPDCVRAIELLASLQNVNSGRITASVAHEVYPPRLYSALMQLSDIPESVKARVKPSLDNSLEAEVERRTTLISCLSEAEPDSRGLSWSALGGLLLDVAHLHAWRHIQWEGTILGANTAKIRAGWKPVLDLHRMGGFVDLHDLSKKRETILDQLTPGFAPEFADMPAAGIARHMMIHRMRLDHQIDKFSGVALLRCMRDSSYRDLISRMRTDSRGGMDIVPLIKEVSPHSPLLMVARIEREWDAVAPQAIEIQEHYSGEPEILSALADRYNATKQPTEEANALRQLSRIAPSYNVVSRIAALAEEAGDREAWLEAYHEYLEEPEIDLTHARVRVNIAEFYLNEGRYEEALPYAEAAGESYSEWSLRCLARCYELLGKADEAAEVWTACAERYASSQGRRFYFLFRTGRDNKETNQGEIDHWFDAVEQRRKLYEFHMASVIQSLQGDHPHAFKTLMSQKHISTSKANLLLIASLADSMNRPEDRNLLWTDALSTELFSLERQTKAPELNDLIRFLQADVSAGANGDLDIAAIDRLIGQAREDMVPTTIAYFAGMYLLSRGETEAGIRYLKFTAASPFLDDHVVVLASNYLHRQKIAVSPRRKGADERVLLPAQ